MSAQYEAVDYGCQQVLWLYGDDHQITEAGTMNIFLHWINEDGGQPHYQNLSFAKHRLFCCAASRVVVQRAGLASGQEVKGGVG